MNKFKVGDKVRVKNVEVRTILHSHKFHPGMRTYIGKEFTIRKEYDDGTYRLDGIPYFWEPDLLEPANSETIVIYRNGDKTVAVDKTTGKKAEAKCSTKDTYDFYTGAKIAFERLIGEGKAKEEPKPKLYNGKVLCVKSMSDYLTEGRVYEFKDGCSNYDDGDRLPVSGDRFVSFEDLKKRMFSEFVELVED